MKKMTVLLMLFLFAGCGKILLPYHENFLCSRGAETGYCGSLRDVYNQVVKENKYREYERLLSAHATTKEKGDASCHDCKK
ncbi:MAG TPA: hypothetical protein ENG51_10450 [Deltaproteobacteria bacterium]|nr:hypothetical protein [Deltaproteobacteria bacterium]